MATRKLLLQSFSFTNIRATTKLFVVLSWPLLLLVCTGALALYNLERLRQTQAWVDHTHRVITQATEIIGAAVDMETGTRGFLLAGSGQFLEPYEWGSEQVFNRLETLSVTVSDNPPQVERLQKARDVLVDWQTNVAAMQIELRREIGVSKTMEELSALVGQGVGKKYFDKFRNLMAEFVDVEVALMDERVAANEAMRSLTIFFIVGSVAIAVIIGSLLARWIGLDMRRAINDTIAAMTRLRARDYDGGCVIRAEAMNSATWQNLSMRSAVI